MKKILIIGSQGYIGSNLANYLKNKKIDVTLVDSQLRKSNLNNSFIQSDYQSLNPDFLNEFTDCIWLAGHSSVKMSVQDPGNALDNNFIDLITFIDKFNGRFIYASSGSLYSRVEEELCTEESFLGPPQNIYDFSKLAFDNYISATKLQAIGLRFGTVNGFGSNIKKELMINAMVKSCKDNGYLTMNNENFYRPILWLQDLLRAIGSIIDSDINSGIYNLCSLNSSIKNIGQGVADLLDCDIKLSEDSPTYNFKMSNKKFCNHFSYHFEGSIEKIVNDLEQGSY